MIGIGLEYCSMGGSLHNAEMGLRLSASGRRSKDDAARRRRGTRAAARRVTARLTRVYGSPHHNNKLDALDELIFIVLSQMTTHVSFDRVYDRLKRRFPTWNELLAAAPADLEGVIREAGLSRQKAPRIRAIIERARSDFGSISYDKLLMMSDSAVYSYLTSLPGVGPKTAKCVMMYAMHRKVLPVDTHLWRIARRLGLVPPSTSYATIHGVLEPVVGLDDRYALHVNAIAHGRAVCLPKRPRCSECCLRRSCVTFAQERRPASRSNSSDR